MTDTSPTNRFDMRAEKWDSDPVKLARALAVADGIRAQVPTLAHARALEYGCGTGLLSFALQPDCAHMCLADSSPGMLAMLNEKIAASGVTNMSPRKLDLVTDHLPSERYDLIYTLMTIHHIRDTDKLLSDFHALLTPSGYLCIADLDTEDGSFHGPEFDGHKGFDRDDLGRKAEGAGFRNVRFSTVFHTKKGAGQNQAEYPVFLMVASK